jgi:hypothetical protein
MSDVTLEILKFVLAICGPVLTILLTMLVKKLLDKAGLERTAALNDLIDKHVATAVEYVERFANKLAPEPMSGQSKAGLAVATVLGELEKAGIKDVASEFIQKRIEAYLEVKSPSSTK